MAGAGSIGFDENISFPLPLLGVCAYGSDIGKTTLLTRLIPALATRGLRVSVIKHAHHRFDIDHPGKDSYRLREAGAVQTLIGSRHRWAVMTELARVPEAIRPETDLAILLARIEPAYADLVLIEGFKQAPIAKIEVHRPALGMPLLADHDPHIIAIAADAAVITDRPVLDLDDPEAVADFVMQWLASQPTARLPVPISS